MSVRLIPYFILLVVLDLVLYFNLKTLFDQHASLIVFTILFCLASLFVLYALYKLNHRVADLSIFQSPSINLYVAAIFLSLIPKLFFCSLLLLQTIGTYLYKWSYQLINSSSSFETDSMDSLVVLISLVLAAIVFLLMLYGMTFGKYNYKVNKLRLSFADLPPEFVGYKVLQISDIHAGSYDNIKGAAKAVSIINKLEADIVLFTGDLINDHKDEIDPYIDVFKNIKAKDGVYAVLGNHDYYGAYRQADKHAYWKDFYAKYIAMDWNLLNNDSIDINKGSGWIKIVGVENWGASKWFPKRGDLNKALTKVNEEDFCILMSHDPTHWDYEILKHKKKIQLTLSGHTHGFQFGINLFGLKWSPAKYRYPRWMGLYESNDQLLYVNRGLGFLAFPGRIGMSPEITVIELSRRS